MSKEKKGKAVDAGCRNLTASWVRQRAEQSPNDDIELCDYFEVGGGGFGRSRPPASFLGLVQRVDKPPFAAALAGIHVDGADRAAPTGRLHH